MNDYDVIAAVARAYDEYGPCIACGAHQGEPCRYRDTPGKTGQVRPEPHFYRGRPEPQR